MMALEKRNGTDQNCLSLFRIWYFANEIQSALIIELIPNKKKKMGNEIGDFSFPFLFFF